MEKSSLTEYTKEQEEAGLASLWDLKFKNSMLHKAPEVKKWIDFYDAYNGDFFKNKNVPEYKSSMVSNYVFSIVETVRPIMLDNDPKFGVLPRNPKGVQFSTDVYQALSYEYDREKIKLKVFRELVNGLVTGNYLFFVPWDADKKNVKVIPVNPFNFFVDPLATSLDDAEYCMYASYKSMYELKRMYPERQDDLQGSSINYSELVNDNDENANINDQILVLEVYTRDFDNEEEIKDGKMQSKPKYPNGRQLTILPELGIVLEDKGMPYNDKEFPFIHGKDYDIPGKFWGEGEVAQLLSPQKHMNDLNNAIIDNARTTANMPWIVDKNAGIGLGKITSRPGLVIRKNPGSEVRRDQPPAMPHYVANAIETYKSDIEQISGIYNTIKGGSATGVYTAQGILALQEAGQVRIRLKVKLLEDALSRLGGMIYSRMKQYWKEEKWIRVTHTNGEPDLKKFRQDALKYDYDIQVTAGSTMPVNRGAMLDMMVRLAQTQMPDGQSLVDREAVVEYLPQEIRAQILQRMEGENVALIEVQQALEEANQKMEELYMQLEEVNKESDQNDNEAFSAIEEITQTLEHLGEQIGQLQEERDKMVAEEEQTNHDQEVKRSSYNEGFQSAEGLYGQQQGGSGGVDELPPGLEGMDDETDELPDELLEGLENMTDDELQLLMEQYPEIYDLIN